MVFFTAENEQKLSKNTKSSSYLTSLRQAKSRGVSTSVVGLIFATYSLLVFIFAPICGLLVSSFMFFSHILIKIERSTQELIVIKLINLIVLATFHCNRYLKKPSRNRVNQIKH